MKVLVTGDRDWTDPNLVWNVLNGYWEPQSAFVVIEGGATGADAAAERWAQLQGRDHPLVVHEPYPAHWKHLPSCPPDCKEVVGKPAGILRNRKMLKVGQPDVVLAFHDHLEVSKGTKDMMNIADAAAVPVILVQHYRTPGRLT